MHRAGGQLGVQLAGHFDSRIRAVSLGEVIGGVARDMQRDASAALVGERSQHRMTAPDPALIGVFTQA